MKNFVGIAAMWITICVWIYFAVNPYRTDRQEELERSVAEKYLADATNDWAAAGLQYSNTTVKAVLLKRGGGKYSGMLEFEYDDAGVRRKKSYPVDVEAEFGYDSFRWVSTVKTLEN